MTEEIIFEDAFGFVCAEPEECMCCGGTGIDYGETCVGCGGLGKVCLQ